MLAVTLVGRLSGPGQVHAEIVIQAPYSASYSATSLGSVPGVPSRYGGMTFKFDDPNTILIGGTANEEDGALYSIGVVRGTGNHITGFSGTATRFADAAYNDGGVAYGPGNVLFLARWPNNEIGETKPGSTITDKVVDLSSLVLTDSPGGLNFVPAGFPGEGHLKLVTWSSGDWYDVTYLADGSGTYDITAATLVETIEGGPEAFAYVPPGSPVFAPNSMLQAEYDSGVISTYQVDASGDPILSTRAELITDLTGAEGAIIDPLTGDFLFSTFGGGEQVVLVQGFASPSPTPTPTPSPTPTTTPGTTRTLQWAPGWHNAVWTGGASTPEEAFACAEGKYAAAYRYTASGWKGYFPGLPDSSTMTDLAQYDTFLILITDSVTCEMPIEAAPGASRTLQWAVGWQNEGWTGADGTAPEEAFACAEGSYAAAYRYTAGGWEGYFPGLPGSSTMTDLAQYDAFLILVTAPVSCSMPITS
jgi:hypothetical protein